ncbi:response regulator [Spartinivicinus poritis]|uniref:Response regulator n=1 Tax=Spartinivicinus poritis TaxID=2994640 RepID=A0ABT5UCH6_9GAMM|nr:response regulator [Spartinivicinus sp. A2-2]MDE1463696.1 response regulator [Spartinivicinus sp. A2-2]
MTQLHAPTVLLFDQDLHTQQTVQEVCQQHNIPCAVMTKFEQLLQCLACNQPLCIICSDTAIGIDVPSQLDQIHTINSHIPIIMLGEQQVEVSVAVSAIKAGAMDFIEKPAIRHPLQQHIDTILSSLH